MSDRVEVSSWNCRALVASGGVLAATGIALSAYAAHGVVDETRASLQMAALFAFGHGVALAALAPMANRRLARASLAGMLLGVVIFSGSLATSHFFGAPTRLAPFGGGLMILGWVLYAAGALRR